MIHSIKILLLAIMSVMLFSACSESSDQQAGETTMEKAEEMAEDAGQAIEDGAEKVAEVAEDGAEAVAEATEDAVEATEEALDAAGEKINLPKESPASGE